MLDALFSGRDVVADRNGSLVTLRPSGSTPLAAHRSKNPYVHLLVGCALFLVASLIPWVGSLATFVIVMVAVGVLVRTRAGGKLAEMRAVG